MDEAFQVAFSAQRQHRVLGVRLDRLTVGHLLLLESSGVDLTEPLNFSELAFCVLVCSTPWPRSERTLQSGWLVTVFQLWGILWRRRDILPQIEAWNAFLSEQIATPNIKVPLNAQRYATPLGVRLLAMLMREMGMRMDDAKGTPVAQANCLWAAVGDLEGTIQLWTERDQNFWDQCAKLDKEWEASNGAA